MNHLRARLLRLFMVLLSNNNYTPVTSANFLLRLCSTIVLELVGHSFHVRYITSHLLGLLVNTVLSARGRVTLGWCLGTRLLALYLRTWCLDTGTSVQR